MMEFIVSRRKKYKIDETDPKKIDRIICNILAMEYPEIYSFVEVDRE